jgi:hypothetical protein
MKRATLILIFLTMSITESSAQKSKTELLEEGHFIFTQRETLSQEGSENFTKKAIESVIQEREEEYGEELSEEERNFILQAAMLFPQILRETISEIPTEINMQFNLDSLVRASFNNGIKENEVRTNLKTKVTYIERPVNSNTYEVFEEYQSNWSLPEFIIDKEDQKEILGYQCYKVTYSEPADLEDEFEFVAGNKIIEMYVTENIRSPFHPTVKNPKILEQFFPMEIIDYYENFRGWKTITVAKKVDFNK